MAIAKVILNGETLMDVTSNTVTSENLLSGQTAIGNNGEPVTGELVGGPYYGIYDSIIRAGSVYASGSSYNNNNQIEWKYTSEDVTNWINSYSQITNAAFQGVTFYGSFYFNNVSSYIRNHAFAFGYCDNGTGLTNGAEFYFNNFSSVLDNGVFYYNRNIINVAMPLCTSIESYAFYSASIKSVNFPVCTKIDTSAFYGCAVREVSFPACTKIGSYAFNNCRSLNKAVFPICTEIASYAFTNCRSLSLVNFPTCLTIDNGAFSNCSQLTTVNFPKCETINQYAFNNCPQLTTVFLSNCLSIGGYAFSRCCNLISLYLLASSVVYIPGTTPFMSTPLYNYSTSASRWGSIFVRASLYEAYMSAGTWGNALSSRIASLTDSEIADLSFT